MDSMNTASETLIAALFVTNGGSYYGLEGVDPWDEERDAQLYSGPYPVVAHPPCARWSRLAAFTQARFGYKIGDDGGCFESALASVRKWGGVLEHPAYSRAWTRFELPKPITTDGGRYGLPVKKATWLYAYGVELLDLKWGRTPDSLGEEPNGPHGGIDNWRDRWVDGKSGDPERHPRALAPYWRQHRHDGMRSTTPPEFRDALIAMARSARVTSEAAA